MWKVSNSDNCGLSDVKTFSDFTSKELFEKHLFPTAASGVIDRLIFHPWETVITIKQDTGQRACDITYDLWRKKGLVGFYKGYAQNVIAAIPIRVSIFGTYSFVTEQGRYTRYSPITISLFAGALTGFLESTLLNPVDAYRIRKTLPATEREPFHMNLLFKGYSALLIRTTIENTICLLGTDLLINVTSEDKRHCPETRYYCAFLAGAASQFFSTPFDTVKTRRIKTPDQSYWQVLNSLYSEEGIKALFRSTGIKAMRAGVCNAMMIGTSSLIKKAIDNGSEREIQKTFTPMYYSSSDKNRSVYETRESLKSETAKNGKKFLSSK